MHICIYIYIYKTDLIWLVASLESAYYHRRAHAQRMWYEVYDIRKKKQNQKKGGGGETGLFSESYKQKTPRPIVGRTCFGLLHRSSARTTIAERTRVLTRSACVVCGVLYEENKKKRKGGELIYIDRKIDR